MPPQSNSFSDVDGPKIAQQNSSLLNLPAELRNRIYELTYKNTVAGNAPIYREYRDSSPPKFPKAPGLLMACKQIHAEALQIYYSTTMFEFGRYHDLVYKCTGIGSIRQNWIRNIKLCLPPDPVRLRDRCWLSKREHLLTANKFKDKDLRFIAKLAESELQDMEKKTSVPRKYATGALRLGPACEVSSTDPVKDMKDFIEYKNERDGGADVSEKERERPWLAEWFERGSFDRGERMSSELESRRPPRRR